MATLTLNISPIFTNIRREYLYNMQAHHEEYESAYLFSATSLRNHALTFTCLTEKGAQFTRLPVSAFCSKPHPEHIPLEYLQLWNNFSYNFTVIRYSFLQNTRCRVILKDKSIRWASYIATFDWYGGDANEVDVGLSEVPEGHKTAHLIELDCGCYALQPNNRIYWSNADFVTKPFKDNEAPDYLTNTQKWTVEQDGRWATEDTNNFFYTYKDAND